jgi:hypothetical protein
VRSLRGNYFVFCRKYGRILEGHIRGVYKNSLRLLWHQQLSVEIRRQSLEKIERIFLAKAANERVYGIHG